MKVLIAVAVLVVSSGTAFAQGAPPMKMGLWETVSTTTMQMPPAMAEKMKGMAMAAPRTTTSKSCVTPDSWQRSLAFINNPSKSCTYGDKTVTATGMTFSMTCNTGGMTSSTKGVITFDSSEKATSTVHMEMAMPASAAGGGTMVTEIKGTSRFVGADCGDVKPYAGTKP